MQITRHDTGHYIQTARELARRVEAISDQIDQERQIPSELAADFADKGLFRLLVPQALGGAELAHPDFLQILEIFAKVDASTAWSINQNNVFATDCVRMPEEIASTIWADRRAVVTNGPPAETAKAVPVDGGYLLSGLWNFSSGSTHATWIAALAPVEKADRPQHSVGRGEGNLILLLPKEEVNFVDLWQVNGLRGTASPTNLDASGR